MVTVLKPQVFGLAQWFHNYPTVTLGPARYLYLNKTKVQWFKNIKTKCMLQANVHLVLQIFKWGGILFQLWQWSRCRALSGWCLISIDRSIYIVYIFLHNKKSSLCQRWYILDWIFTTYILVRRCNPIQWWDDIFNSNWLQCEIFLSRRPLVVPNKFTPKTQVYRIERLKVQMTLYSVR